MAEQSLLPSSAWYNAGAVVAVSATANTGYSFTGFTGALTGTTTPQNVTISAPASVTAGFTVTSTGTYTYNRPVTISHAKVPNTDQASFPVLFNTTDNTLKSVANGGHVTSASGYDIIFTSDGAGTYKLNHEVQSYNPATGQFIGWVQVPALSHTADTVVYLFYGNSGITSSQENKSGVWDSNYVSVWHLGTTNGLSSLDSTSNNNSSVVTGSGVSSAAAMIGTGASLDGSAIAYLDMGTSSTLDMSGAFTISTWFKKTAYSANWEILMSKCSSSACNYELAIDGTNHDLEGVQNSTLIESGIVPALNQWHHVVEVSNGSNLSFYLDGALGATKTGGTGAVLSGTHFDLGREQIAGENFSGILNEARLSKAARSADWIATEYNNQSSPSTFYTFGTESGASQQLATPTFSAGTGTYTTPQTITISGPSGASIRYTADSSAPSSISGTLYSNPVAIGSTTTLKAITLKPGGPAVPSRRPSTRLQAPSRRLLSVWEQARTAQPKA